MPSLGGSGGSGGASVSELTAEPAESIAAGTYVNASGRQWLNDTLLPIIVPAIITSGSMSAAGFVDVTGTREDWADTKPVADEAARLALVQIAKPYLRVRQADTDEIHMQIAQPPSNAANWLLVSGTPIFTLTDGGDTLTDGGDALIER